MKIANVLLLALLTMVYSSCTKDEIENISDNELVGLWRISNVYFEGTSSANASGNDEVSTFNGTGYNLTLSIEFNDEEDEFTSKGNYNIRLITNVNGDDDITEWMNPGFIECGTWRKDGNNLTISKPDGEIQVATILSMKQNTLELSYDFSYEVMKSELIVVYQVNGIFRFEKQ